MWSTHARLPCSNLFMHEHLKYIITDSGKRTMLPTKRYFLRKFYSICQRLSKTESSRSFFQFKNVLSYYVALVPVAPKGISIFCLFAENAWWFCFPMEEQLILLLEFIVALSVMWILSWSLGMLHRSSVLRSFYIQKIKLVSYELQCLPYSHCDMISNLIQKVQFELEEEMQKCIRKMRRCPLYIKLDSDCNFRRK